MEGAYMYKPGDHVVETACFKIKYGPREYRVGNFGHVGFVGGAGGTKKSTFVKSICAAGLSKRQILFNKVDIGDRKILYFDTEMPKDLFVNHIERMFKSANLNPADTVDRFIAHSIVAVSEPEKKRQFVFDEIHKIGDQAGIVVIDVVADLFDDENDTQQAQKFIAELASLAQDYNTMYMIVSHLSDMGKLLGSLGRKLDRKASFGMLLEKINNKTSQVESGKARYEEYPPFDFSLDADGIPEPGEYVPFPVIKTKR